MKRFLQLMLVWLGCLHLCGGSSGFLQLVAWTGMAVSYSARDGLMEGLTNTFDGEHPCPLCLAIAAAERENNSPADDETPMPSALEKLIKDPVGLAEVMVPALPCATDTAAAAAFEMVAGIGRGSERPGLPPPRRTA